MVDIVAFFESVLGSDWMIYLGAGIFVIAMLFIALFFVLQKRRKKTFKDKQQLFNQITQITKQKAELEAKLLGLKETSRYGHIPKKDMDSRMTKIDTEIKRLDIELDKLIDKIAEEFFEFTYKKEVAKDQEKVNYLVKLQQQKHEFDNKIFKLEQELKETKNRLGETTIEKSKAEASTTNIEENLKMKIRELEFEVDRLKKSKGIIRVKDDEKEKEKDENYYKNIILTMLAKRYSGYINEHEIKTVQALKDAIQPDNSVIIDLIQNFSSTDHLKAASQAYDFVTKNIRSVSSIGINFWMSIEEMMENKVADYEDKAILLCSILRAIDLDAWVMVTELKDGSNRPFVIINKDKNVLLLDPNNQHDFLQYSGKFEEVLKTYFEKGNRISRPLYKFNETDYEELTQ